MRNLDDLEHLRALDPDGMMQAVVSFPDQVKSASKILPDFDRGNYQGINKIVVSGMGGSAIGGDLLRTYLAESFALPVVVVRNYELPGFVDEQTLVFIVTFSGNTEETLGCFEDACQKKARIIGISSNGKLEKLCKERNIPCLLVPRGGQPRAALGYLFLPLLKVLDYLGLISFSADEISEVHLILQQLLEKYRPEIPLADNPAKLLAKNLESKIPLIYASSPRLEAVAWRWKDQLNENGKTFAICNTFSELNHNEIVGWSSLKEITAHFYLVILRDKKDFSRFNLRVEITKDILKDKVAGIQEVWTAGEYLLSRLLSLIYLSDFVSVYLALLYGFDPTRIANIDYLKKELAKVK